MLKLVTRLLPTFASKLGDFRATPMDSANSMLLIYFSLIEEESTYRNENEVSLAEHQRGYSQYPPVLR
jgi:hypothetical protein